MDPPSAVNEFTSIIPEPVNQPLLVVIPSGVDQSPAQSLFDSPLFQVEIVKDYYPELTPQQNQVKIILEALRKTELERPDQPVLLVFPNVTSSSTPDKIHRLIVESWSYYQVNPWDLILFNRYLDQCNEYVGPMFQSNQSNILVSNIAPFGSLAMLISPMGRDRLLGKMLGRNGTYISYGNWNTSVMNQIASSNLLAFSWIPNLIEYLVVPKQNQNSPIDMSISTDPLFPPQPLFPVLSECAPSTSSNGATPAPVGWGPFLIGLLIIVIIFILAWALYIIGPQPRLFAKFDQTQPVTSTS